MPLELRKGFQIAIALISLVLAATCWLLIRPYLKDADNAAQAAFATLSIVTVPGFTTVLRLFLPLILVKLFPVTFQ